LATSGSPGLWVHCPTALWTRGHVVRSAAGWPHRTLPRALACPCCEQSSARRPSSHVEDESQEKFVSLLMHTLHVSRPHLELEGRVCRRRAAGRGRGRRGSSGGSCFTLGRLTAVTDAHASWSRCTRARAYTHGALGCLACVRRTPADVSRPVIDLGSL